ncbi:MAG: transcriptional repressor [Prevotella sp.]|nr:transcriptional repressor [Prevotella sp.]MCM1074440.1 transcriptional repressor [Ruminococcus sp.]
MTGHEGYIQAVKLFNRWLESKHLRKTQERFAVLKAVWGMPGHFGAEELRQNLEKVGYHVSRATVYNTFGLLEECGVIRRHHFANAGGEALYEKNQGTHLHLICTRCGAVSEREADAEINALLSADRYGGFSPSHLSAYIYGLCANCAATVQTDN